MVNKNYYSLALIGALLLHTVLGYLLLRRPEFKQRITLASSASTAQVISAFTITAKELTKLSNRGNSNLKAPTNSSLTKTSVVLPTKAAEITTSAPFNSTLLLKQLQKQTLEARKAELKAITNTLRSKKQSASTNSSAVTISSQTSQQTILAGDREFKLAGGTITSSDNQAILTLGRAIAAHWVKPHNLDAKDFIKISLKIAVDGTITSTQIIASSNHPALEHSALTALANSSPLPIAGIPYQDIAQLTVTFRNTGIS